MQENGQLFVERVLISPEALKVVEQLQEKYGELIFHQSGGCCDGSSPMCYEKGEFITGSSDVWMGTVAGCNFFMSTDQFEYWKHTQLTLDVTPGRGSSFSLEIPMGIRFLIRSRIFQPHEMENLIPIKSGDDFS
ncbi:MAG: DUF779 domain-containing protein [Saprospirales bacterium]|nr:MAG: DUF779 domain-containing protein [Saprospirales bacterium]